MKAQAGRPPFFHRAGVARGVPALLIAGIAIVLFSSAGVARMLGWGTGSTGESDDILAPEQAVPSKCPECSMVVSMREIKGRDANSGPGARGSVAERNLDEPRAPAVRNYAITIRQADQSSRVINLTGPARWRTGERVIVIDGAPPSGR